MAWDWDKIKSTKTVARESVPIIMDREWGQKLGEAQIRADFLQQQAAKNPSDTTLLPEIEELNAEIERLSAQRDDKVCVFVFRGISGDRYERLVGAHRPTKDQRTAAAQRGQTVSYNEDTFPLALVQVCLVEPRLTRDQIAEIWDGGDDDMDPDADDAPAGARWNSAEKGALFQGAQLANMSRPSAM